MWADHAADQIMGGLHVGHPVADGFVDSVFKGAGARLDRHDLSLKELHPEYVQRLSFDILAAHVDDAFQTKHGASGGGSDAVLSSPGLGDDPLLAHMLSQQRLAQGVIDLVGSCVCQVFTFQVDLGPAADAGQVLREVQSGGTPGVAVEQMAQALLEFRVGLGRLVRIVQFGDRSHQRFGDEFPTKVAESASVIGEEEVPLIYIRHEVFLLIC